MIDSRAIVLKSSTVVLPYTADTTQLQKLIADTARLKKYRMVNGTLNAALRNGESLKILVVPLAGTSSVTTHPRKSSSFVYVRL
jgi:hypothetical protein